MEEKTGCISFSLKNSDQIGDVNCVPWSVTIFKGFPYFGKCSLDNLLITALVFDRLSGYKTTYFENASKPKHHPQNRLSALNFTGGWFQIKVAYDSSVIRSPGTPIRGHTPVWQSD